MHITRTDSRIISIFDKKYKNHIRMYLLLLIPVVILLDLLDEIDRTKPNKLEGTEGSSPIC